MTTEMVTAHDCPGEPGFECSDTPGYKGFCERCYHRQWSRNNPRQDRSNNGECPGEPGFECSDTMRGDRCGRCYQRAYMRAHAEDYRAYQKEWYETNRPERLAQLRDYYNQNRPRIRERQNRYHEENRELIRERNRRDYRQNKAARLETSRRWAKANPDRRADSARRRRARKYGAGRIPYNSEELAERLSVFGNRCWMCGVEDAGTVDHLIPLSRGGPDCLSNLRPACQSCNSSKGDKTPKEWAAHVEGL